MKQGFWNKFKEFVVLLKINLIVGVKNFFEFLRVVGRYYSNVSFLKIDLTLIFSYLFHPPYRISKKFLIENGAEEIYAYGETPLTTLEEIANQCNLSKKDVVYELGSGRGRTCFWLNAFIGCKVVGIEYIPEFVEKAQKVKKRFDVQGVEFRLEDFMDADMSKATVIYLYGTCLEDHLIRKLIEKFATLAPGTKIITVSYPLTDYTNKPLFEVMKRFTVSYTWGETDLYLHIVKAN